MEYRSQNHSKFLLLFHTIFVCKYRKKLLVKLGDEIKDIIMDISAESDFDIETMEVDVDHIHLLINSVPKLSPLSIVKKLKQMSTHRIWINNKVLLRKHFWKEHTFWSDGYFISSIGNASEETIRKYIESQG
jgi:putative transposase